LYSKFNALLVENNQINMDNKNFFKYIEE
jgi:hypothetical protein